MQTIRKSTLIVTYCSRDKDPRPVSLPAVDRYLSNRIRITVDAASSLELESRILSGLYGLLEPRREIPPYDHLLTHDQVDRHALLLESQLREAEVALAVFVTRPLSVDPNTAPYRKTMEKACAAAEAAFTILEFETPDPSPVELAERIRSLSPGTGC